MNNIKNSYLGNQRSIKGAKIINAGMKHTLVIPLDQPLFPPPLWYL